jgi:hypothetical protein
MRHSSRRAARPPAGAHRPLTIVALVLLGLAAVAVVVDPNIASASQTSPRAPANAPSVPSTTAASGGGAATGVPPVTGAVTGGVRRTPAGAAAASPVPSGVDLDAGVPGVAPPAAIADDCSADVSAALQAWLATLPADTLVRPPAGACYRVDRGITLAFRQGLTIDGGRWENTITQRTYAGRGRGRATFNVLGGSHVTLEDLTIVGANPGGYHPALAFEAGIDLQGTADAVVRNLAVDHVYGDGITLDPLRGSADHMSGTILAPVSGLDVDTVDITGSGRQGIALVSVDGATIDDVALTNVGQDTFDVEADQANEGATDVTIDGCTSSTWNGGAFFADGGAGNGPSTGHITVENCRMLHPQGGDAVMVKDSGSSPVPRGPITFSDDTLWCGASVYVGCFQLDRADVTVTGSLVEYPKHNSIREVLYHAGSASSLSFVDDSVLGYGHLGQGRSSSTVLVSGGSWLPADAGTGARFIDVVRRHSHHSGPRRRR